jgi:hypothetical protein
MPAEARLAESGRSDGAEILGERTGSCYATPASGGPRDPDQLTLKKPPGIVTAGRYRDPTSSR